MRNCIFAVGFCVSLMSPLAAFADDASCKAVRLSDLGWTDIALTNTTAEVILNALGYETSQTLLGLNVTYESMRNGDIDVFLGNWRPAQDVEFKSYYDDGIVIPVATNLTGAKYTLAVPAYVAKEGVADFKDLAAHGDRFEHTIYGIEPGSNQSLLDMIAADRHGLGDWKIVESSEAAMLAQLDRKVGKDEWIVFLGWQPHPMNTTKEIVYLSGGDVEFGPDYGGATVRTIVRKGYPETCPNVTKFFSNLTFDIAYENAGMALVMNDGAEVEDAARQMIASEPARLETWLAGVTTLDGKPGLDVVKAALSGESKP